MQNHIKYLVIENELEWADAVSEGVSDYFINQRNFIKACVRDFSAYDAKQASQQIEQGGWDLVMLDLNLADKAGKSRISGLDLLGEIAAGNKAYFVIIVTGAVTDPTLEKLYGKETAALLRFGALNEAVRRMPASRVRILHKPDGLVPQKALESLLPHLHSALDQYCSVSLERNIFRPLPGDPGLWEVCFNGGPRLTLKHEEPYKMIRSALAQPNRALKIIQLVQALAQSSGKAGAAVLAPEGEVKAHRRGTTDLEYRGHEEDDVEGLDWAEKEGYGITDGAPVDADDGALSVEVLLDALLQTQRQEWGLERAIASFVENYGEGVVLSLPGKAREWAGKGQQACSRFNSDDAPAELIELSQLLRPLLAPLRERWLADRQRAAIAAEHKGDKKEKKKKSGKVRVARGIDTPELVLARQHWSRFKKQIAARPALMEFRDHIIQWMDRSPTAKGHLYYRPPDGGDLCPFWLTE